MLRAGREIKIDSTKLESKDAILIAPVINLFGIMIRCDRQTPEEIKKFFSSFGADVGRIKYKGELLARIRGNFKIDYSDVAKFIDNNKDLVSEQNANVAFIEDSIVLKNEINSDLKNHDAPITYIFQNKKHDFKHSASNGSTGNDYIMEVGVLTNHGKIFAAKRLILVCNSSMKLTSAVKYANAPVGFMSEMLAHSVLIDSPLIEIENGLLQSETNLHVESETINLSLETGIDWVNNPHPEVSNVKAVERLKLEV